VADAATGRESEEHVPGHASEHGSLKSHAESNAVSAPEISFPASRNDERLAKVEQEVLALRAELEDLKRRLGD
jgi:hypothetical protein